jgi:hypothetical protein
MSAFAEGTPMAISICDLDGEESFLSVYLEASEQSVRYCERYKTELLDYLLEWELVVTTRVDKELKECKKLRDTYNHYNDKVESLRKKVIAMENKGKVANEALATKVKRNEEKLDEASGDYESAAAPLCYLMEEVVHMAYKDLQPLVVSMMQWEVGRSTAQASVFAKFGAATAASPKATPFSPKLMSKSQLQGSSSTRKVAMRKPDDFSERSDSTAGSSRRVDQV